MKFQDDISNMNTYIHTDKPKPICPPLFQSWGHNDGVPRPASDGFSMVTLFWFTIHNKDKMLKLVHRKMNVLYVCLVSSKYIYRLQSYGKSPITSGSPIVCTTLSVG